MRLELTVFLVALSACASASHARIGPDTFAVECNRGRVGCYKEASVLCPDGFDILDSDSQQGAVATAQTWGNVTTVSAAPTYRGEMLVKCRGRVAAPVKSSPSKPKAMFAGPKPE